MKRLEWRANSYKEGACALIVNAGCLTNSKAIDLIYELLIFSVKPCSTEIQIELFLEELKLLISTKGSPLRLLRKIQEAAIKGMSYGFVYPFIYDG